MIEIDTGDSIQTMMGRPSTFACPECKGTLFEIEEGGLLRFRCHEGHAYSPMSLEAGQSESLESALWNAIRALDEKGALSERLLQRAEELGQTLVIDKFRRDADRARFDAEQIRQLLRKSHEIPWSHKAKSRIGLDEIAVDTHPG